MANKGLKSPNQKNVGKVLNRLHRMSVPYDSYAFATATKRAKEAAPKSMQSIHATQKSFNPQKAQKLYESSNKLNQTLRRIRLRKFSIERMIPSEKGHKGYKGKLDTNKSDLVKDIKKFRTMGNIKKLSPVGLVGAIMQPKKVGDATLNGNKGEYKRIK